MIRPGNLRDFVTIEAPTTTRNAAGQLVGWVEFAKVYAQVEPLAGRELIAARALLSPVSVRVRTWYLVGLTPSMRLRLGDRVLNVLSVVDVGNMHVELELACSEIQ